MEELGARPKVLRVLKSLSLLFSVTNGVLLISYCPPSPSAVQSISCASRLVSSVGRW